MDSKILLRHSMNESDVCKVKHALNEDMILSLNALFQHNLNITKAARSLYVHRNTLVYRCTKFKEKTGFDPLYFYDAVKLHLILSCLHVTSSSPAVVK